MTPRSEAERSPLAIVTGGNRGLGLEICRQLAAAGRRVLLTARDAAQAERAAASLGDAVAAHPLDVTDADSMRSLAGALRARGEPVVALVNNAGISLRGFDAEVVRRTLAVNYHGAVRVTEALRPLLTPDACVVMVSSGMGELSAFSAALRQRLLASDLTREALDSLLGEFLQAVERGTYRREGWPGSAYRVSKAALNAYVRILAREWAGTGVRINAVCPGWVRTGMGGRTAPRGVAKGARGIVWAATLPAGGPSGGFFRDGKAIEW